MTTPVAPRTDRKFSAALSTLIILQSVMLASLYADVAPRPPAAVFLFGIGPFLGASLSVAVAALIMGPGTSRPGSWLGLLAAALALISFGPQKYFDAQFSLIWPAVVAGQLACAVLVWQAFAPALPESSRNGAVASRPEGAPQ